MKLHFRLLTNKYFFTGFIIVLVGILTAINNLYFYEHVDRSAGRNAHQLKSMLESEIQFCRNNRISAKRYRENIKTLVKKFSKNAYYNDLIILEHQTRGILWKKPTKDWDKVVASDIQIIIPKLKSNDNMFYHVQVNFEFSSYLLSIIRSMTLSIFDKGIKVLNKNNITKEDRKILNKLKNKEDVYYNKLNELNQHYKDFPMSPEQIQKYKEEKDHLSKYSLSQEEFKTLNILKGNTKNELSSYDLYIAWLRSRPAIGFTIFTVILIWLFRRRELAVAKIEKELENKKILEANFGIPEQNDDIDLYDAVMKNDISKLKNIKSVNPNMNIIKFNAMVNHTEEEKLRILEVLIDKDIKLNFHDDDGMNALMYYAIGNVNDEKDSKIIETLIKNGINIDAQNKSGMTALMLCSIKNRPASVQILIDNRADINIKQDLTAKELAATKEIEEIIKAAEKYSPQSLVKILKNFTEDNPIKYTAHDWKPNEFYEGNYQDYMEQVKIQWDSIKDDLEQLSPNLYEKVCNFLWERDSNVALGWSSMEGLQQWCDEGNYPCDFKNFKDIITTFKKEIEIRKEDNSLKSIFVQERKKLKKIFKEYQKEASVDLTKLVNQNFYTDTENFKNAISTIFSQMSEEPRHKYPNITVECIGDEIKEFTEIKIAQIDSVSQSSAEVMLRQIDNGQFESIKENLKNLCDWSIESSFEDSNYRVNYLKSNNTEDIEELEYKPVGFTHILRFYNR